METKGWFLLSRLTVLILLIASVFSCKAVVNKNAEADIENWEPLFNGKDLSGWTPKFTDHGVGINYKNTFRVEDNILRSSYVEYDTFENIFGHLFHEKEFSYYKLRSEYRFVDQQARGGESWAYKNNGLMLHCQQPHSMTLPQSFPLSLEFQLLGGNGTDERTTGNLCTPGCDVILSGQFEEEHCINAMSPTYHGEQWVKAEAVVLGDSIIHHIVNGDTVITYERPTIGGWLPEFDTINFVKGTPLSSGLIAIQAESHPTDFKYIDVLDLCGCMDKKAKNYKSYYIKPDQTKCVY